LAGGLSPFLILFPDAITFKAFSFYDDRIFRVFIGHRPSKLKFSSKSPEKISPSQILGQIRQYASGNTFLNMVAWHEGGTMRIEFNYLKMSA